MTAITKYRQGLVAFLLVLYAFIATPVHYWHHHACYQTDHSILTTNKSKHPVILAKSSSGAADDCKICSHKYSVYNDLSLSPESLDITIHSEYTLAYKKQPLSCFRNRFLNKGPPALN